MDFSQLRKKKTAGAFEPVVSTVERLLRRMTEEVRSHPGVALGVAAACGVLLGIQAKRR
jgi:ElaB/YqjD/DUF883 family membrane-anchored ribosome-binding protein